MQNLKSSLSKLLFHLVGALSLSSARRLGHLLGSATYHLNTRMVQVSRENLDICLPHLKPKQRELLVKHSLQETGKTATEICVIWRATKPPLQSYVTQITGEELVNTLFREGKGLIVLAPHLGNWEMLGHYLATLGPVTNLYQPPKLKGLDPLIQSSRKKAGCELVPADIKGVAMLLKSLKAGGISGILPDQNPNDLNSGRFIPFFGEPALTMVLAHKLIRRTKCKTVFAYAKRVELGFELIFREPPGGIYSNDTDTALNALNQGVESLVLEAPEQYQWEYKRFKNTNPDGDVRRYL